METFDLLGDEPAVPHVARCSELSGTVRRPRFVCFDDPPVGRRNRWTAKARTCVRYLVAWQPCRRGCWPMTTEEFGYGADRDCNIREQRVTILSEGDGRLQDVAKAPAAIAFDQEHPCSERAGHNRGQQAGARDDV